MLFPWLAAGPSPESVLLQYGAIGVFALFASIALVTLWRRQDRNYEENIKIERRRGDRLETELLALNKLISSELSGHLVRATEAMKEVTDVVRRRDR